MMAGVKLSKPGNMYQETYRHEGLFCLSDFCLFSIA
jgi:hypothetical protein